MNKFQYPLRHQRGELAAFAEHEIGETSCPAAYADRKAECLVVGLRQVYRANRGSDITCSAGATVTLRTSLKNRRVLSMATFTLRGRQATAKRHAAPPPAPLQREITLAKTVAYNEALHSKAMRSFISQALRKCVAIDNGQSRVRIAELPIK